MVAVQYRAIDRRRAPRDILRDFDERADALKTRVLEKMADVIIAGSPVDTGVYIMSHSIGDGGRARGLATTSSAGRPRGQPHAQFAAPARAQLAADIAALPKGARNVMLRNTAAHAPFVEYVGWGGRGAYHVYANTRARAAEFIAAAAAELGFE